MGKMPLFNSKCDPSETRLHGKRWEVEVPERTTRTSF